MPGESLYGYFHHPEDTKSFPVREGKAALFRSDNYWE